MSDESSAMRDKPKRVRKPRMTPSEVAVAKLANLPFDAIKPTAESMCRDYGTFAKYFRDLLTDGIGEG